MITKAHELLKQAYDEDGITYEEENQVLLEEKKLLQLYVSSTKKANVQLKKELAEENRKGQVLVEEKKEEIVQLKKECYQFRKERDQLEKQLAGEKRKMQDMLKHIDEISRRFSAPLQQGPNPSAKRLAGSVQISINK